MNIQVNDYVSNQQQEVKNFILNVWKEYGFVYMSEFDSDLDDPNEFYIKPGGMFYVLMDEDRIIGTIGVINKGNHVAELKRFYIDINYRRKGYGTQLYNRAVEFCKEKEFEKIEFETGKDFKQGHAFYQKNGFALVGEDKESFFMEKIL